MVLLRTTIRSIFIYLPARAWGSLLIFFNFNPISYFLGQNYGEIIVSLCIENQNPGVASQGEEKKEYLQLCLLPNNLMKDCRQPPLIEFQLVSHIEESSSHKGITYGHIVLHGYRGQWSGEEYYSQIFFHASLEGVRNTGAAKHWSCVTRMHLTV